MRPILACVISAVALTALAVPTDGLAKKGTIHACYAAKRPDKGAMRFVRGKKCHRGEKRLTWNKTGAPGPAGQMGQPGPEGAPGGGSQADIDQLRAQVEQQAARISALESQVSQLGSQYDALLAQVGALGGQITGLGSEFSAFKTVACDQLGDLTSQSNDLGTALDNIDLGGTIPLGLNFINPGAPAALPAFAC